MLENQTLKTTDWSEKLLIILFIGAVPIFCFFAINRSFWYDEVCSYDIAKNSFSKIIVMLGSIANLPFYYFLLSIWMKLFGISEIAIRALSGFFYIVSLPAIYYLGTLLYNNKRTSLICVLLFILSPIAQGHSQNGRYYTLLIFLCILSMIFFFRLILNIPYSKKDIFLLILIHIIGTFTHPWYFFFFFAQIVSYFLLFYKSNNKVILVIFLVSTIPFWVLWGKNLFQQAGGTSASWLEKPTFYTLLETIIGFYGLINPLDVGVYGVVDWLKGILIYICFLLIILVKIEGNKIQIQSFKELKSFITEKTNLAFLLFFFISLIVPFTISQVKPLYVAHRYTVVALLPFIFFIGSLISKFGNRLILVCFGYLLLINSLSIFINSLDNSVSVTRSDREVVRYLITETQEKDAIIFTGGSELIIDYYFALFNYKKDLQKVIYSPDYLTFKDQYSKEAEEQANTAIKFLESSLTNRSASIFFICDVDVAANRMLKKKLDNSFINVRTVSLRGSFYDLIIVYKTKPRPN